MDSEFFDKYIAQKGDSLYQIAMKNNINYKLLAQLNGLNINDYIYPNQEILIPKKDVKYYITADGDTLESITNGLGAKLATLLYQNRKIYLRPEQLIFYKDRKFLD